MLLVFFAGVSCYLLFISGSGTATTTLAQANQAWLYTYSKQEIREAVRDKSTDVHIIQRLLDDIALNASTQLNESAHGDDIFAGVFDGSSSAITSITEHQLVDTEYTQIRNLLKHKSTDSELLGPVYRDSRAWIGRTISTSVDNDTSEIVVFLSIPEETIRGSFRSFLKEFSLIISLVLAGLIVAQLMFLASYIPWAAKKKKRVKPAFISTVLLSAFIFNVTVIACVVTEETDQATLSETIRVENFAAAVSSYVARGVESGEFNEQVVQDLMDKSPSVISMDLIDLNGQFLESWGTVTDQPETETILSRNEVFLKGTPVGHVEVLVNKTPTGIFRIVWYTGITLLVSLLILGELTILVFKWLQRYTLEKSGRPDLLHYSLIRPAMFLFLCGVDLCLSFLPLHMRLLSEGNSVIPDEILSALPISVEFACVGIAMLTVGHVIQRFGWHIPFIGGLIIAALGALYSWIAPDMLSFVLSRGIVGIGYGSALMAAQGYVIGTTSNSNQTHGFADLFAGVYAGSICGAAIGGVLADRLGYGPVFVIGSILLMSTIVYAFIFLRQAFKKVRENRILQEDGRGGIGALVRDRQLLTIIFLSGIPASIAIIGFVHYLCPLFLSDSGLSQTGIGYVVVIYGAFLVYAGPTIGKIADRVDNPRLLLSIGNVIGALGLLSFVLGDEVIFVVIAVTLLGASSSIVLSVQGALVIDLEITKRVGRAPTLAFFRACTRIGQFGGPLVFGSMSILLDTRWAVVSIGALYLLAAVAFWVITSRSEHKSITIGDLT